MQRRRLALVLAVLALVAIGHRPAPLAVTVSTPSAVQMAEQGVAAATRLGPLGIALVLDWSR